MEKPVVLVSECLLGVQCRYDGELISSPFVKKLCVYAEVIAVCPEMKMGLPVPRPKVHLWRDRVTGVTSLVQEETQCDMTEQFEDMSDVYLAQLGNVHGAVMKSKSPSCAVSDAKVYVSKHDEASVERDGGLFTRHLRMRFPQLAIETEATLSDPQVRHEFLVKIFADSHAHGPYPKTLLYDDEIVL